MMKILSNMSTLQCLFMDIKIAEMISL